VWKSEEFGPFFPKESSIYLEIKKFQIEKIAKNHQKKNSLVLTGPRLLSNQDMNVTTVLTYFSIDEGSLFVLFVTMRSPKPQWFQPRSWHCWKALHE
jgi:hypothetical protein